MMVIIARFVEVPWPNEQKARTRERILQSAADAFRARGVSGVPVQEIMASAGLTHGGFYAHFASKDDLLAEALEYAAGQTIDLLSKSVDSVPAEQRLQAVIDTYLSAAHAIHPERGCPVAALGPELVRSGKKIHTRLARALKRRIDWMRSLLTASQRQNVSDEQLVGAFACMVGGLILARSVNPKDSQDILKACREFLHRALPQSTEE